MKLQPLTAASANHSVAKWVGVQGKGFILCSKSARCYANTYIACFSQNLSPFICRWQRSSFLTLFEIVAFLRLRSLRLFLTESHSPFTCHRQRSSSILRNFERCPSPREVVKICIIVNQKLQNSNFLYQQSIAAVHL